MGLDDVVVSRFVERILIEAGRDAPDGEFPARWWIDVVNEAVDDAVMRLYPVTGDHFFVVSLLGVIAGVIDLGGVGLVPLAPSPPLGPPRTGSGPPYEGGQRPGNVRFVLDGSGNRVEWMDFVKAQGIAGIPGFDGLAFWSLLGVGLRISLGSGGAAAGTWSVCHAKRRVPVAALGDAIDLDREFFPVVRADVKLKFYERLRMLGGGVSDEDLESAETGRVKVLAGFGA